MNQIQCVGRVVDPLLQLRMGEPEGVDPIVAKALAFINGDISITMEDLASSSYGNKTEVGEWNRFVISDFEP